MQRIPEEASPYTKIRSLGISCACRRRAQFVAISTRPVIFFCFKLVLCAISAGADASPEEVEAQENRRQLLELDVLHALRVLKAFQQTRYQLLDRMCVRALGQFDAFDEQTLLKLSDNERQYLRDACAAEHGRRDEFNTRNVGDKNGKPSAVSDRTKTIAPGSSFHTEILSIVSTSGQCSPWFAPKSIFFLIVLFGAQLFQFADVVFQKECLLEEPWHFRASAGPDGEGPEVPPLCYFEQGSVSRLPLYRAMQLKAKGIVKVLQVADHQWVQQDSAAFLGLS